MGVDIDSGCCGPELCYKDSTMTYICNLTFLATSIMYQMFACFRFVNHLSYNSRVGKS